MSTKRVRINRVEDVFAESDVLVQELPHQVSLKVMRLAKPSFQVDVPVSDDLESLLGVDGAESAAPSSGLSDSMRMAAIFGEIFLGETFSCYLTVQNISSETISNVVVKAELQTSSKRYTLQNLESNPIPSISPHGTHDCIIRRLIRDEGVHILLCSASYLTGSMGRRVMRKIFKFSVAQPFSMVYRQFHLPGGDVVLETEIENKTTSALCMKQLRFVPSQPLFEVSPSAPPPPADLETGEVFYLPANCTRQFLHQIRPSVNPETGARPPPASPMGFVEVSWSRGWGEVGTIVSPPQYYSSNMLPSSLKSSSPSSPGSSRGMCIEAELAPDPTRQAVAGQPMVVELVVRNTHPFETQALQLRMENKPGSAVLLCGTSGGKILPSIPPREEIRTQLTVLPVRAGLHVVGGVVLLSPGNDTFVFDKVGTISVESGDGPDKM